MKTASKRQPFGVGRFEPIRSVRFVEVDNSFEVEFDSGDTFVLSRAELMKANGLSLTPPRRIDSIWIDAETRSGFFVRFEDGGEAEASWELVKEERP